MVVVSGSDTNSVGAPRRAASRVASCRAEVENLAYFMRFAQAALNKAAAEMERQGRRVGEQGENGG